MRHVRRRPVHRRTRAAVLAAVAGCSGLMGLAPGRADAQDAPAGTATPVAGDARGARAARLPFAPGERLTYEVRTGRFGGVGRSTMWIEGPAALRGSDTWVLRFDFAAKVGPFRAEDRTASWLDARRVASLRFTKHERHPLSRQDEAVDLYPDARRWEAEDGRTGDSPTDAPLDELSFMYFLRTLPLARETDWSFTRHYAAERNPTTVRVVGRETIESAAGRFRTVALEMRVRDPQRYRGEGVIRIHLSDDACRIPVRVESRMPVVGSAVMLLASHNLEGCTAREDSVMAER